MEVVWGSAFIVASIFLFHVLHSLPIREQFSWRSVGIRLLPAVALVLVGWARLGGVRREQETASWRKWAGLIALAGDTLAVSLPWLVFYLDFVLTGSDMRPYQQRGPLIFS
jgi:hypothetical protein